ncbi:hypothetical protein OG883_36980 [Streptomyces sp. NBC_01142]|uniref:hypothetical protein n=1 Tax=Streptomyces sp. NBC_01142 TaxID=2975865 RepID=UPI0022513801|nr:hypothetical protein [Streptomyces sp. NBC_01142]MCX4825353.1 hypothetical protein [Streptomyces sp. NBC_01142]
MSTRRGDEGEGGDTVLLMHGGPCRLFREQSAEFAPRDLDRIAGLPAPSARGRP